MEESKLACETLGEHVFEWFLRNKRAEWAISSRGSRPSSSSATSATGELDGSASRLPLPAPPELAQALDLGGWAWKATADLDTARSEQPADGWVGAVVVAGDEPDEAFRLCRSIRSGDIHVGSVLLLIGGAISLRSTSVKISSMTSVSTPSSRSSSRLASSTSSVAVARSPEPRSSSTARSG